MLLFPKKYFNFSIKEKSSRLRSLLTHQLRGPWPHRVGLWENVGVSAGVSTCDSRVLESVTSLAHCKPAPEMSSLMLPLSMTSALSGPCSICTTHVIREHALCSVGASCLNCVPGWWLSSPVMWHSTHLHQHFAPSVPCLLCNFCPLQSGECVSVFSYWLFRAWISLSFCCVKRLIFLNDAFELYSNRSFKSSVKPFRVTFLVSGQWCPWPPETSHSV